MGRAQGRGANTAGIDGATAGAGGTGAGLDDASKVDPWREDAMADDALPLRGDRFVPGIVCLPPRLRLLTAVRSVSLERRSRSASLAEPVCSLLLELFDMNERTNMLRRQAVQVILQDILGGTIERSDTGQPMAPRASRLLNANARAPSLAGPRGCRRLTENVNWLVNEENLLWYLDRFEQSMWPDGKLSGPWPTRTLEQRETLKASARDKLVRAVVGTMTRGRPGAVASSPCGCLNVLRRGCCAGRRPFQAWWPAWWARRTRAAAACASSTCSSAGR